MSEHTPTPWTTKAAHIYSHAATICSMSEPHASTYVGYTELAIGSPDINEAFANAAFIVKACNSHDALVKALGSALSELDYIVQKHGYVSTETAAVLARETLAKVSLCPKK